MELEGTVYEIWSQRKGNTLTKNNSWIQIRQSKMIPQKPKL